MSESREMETAQALMLLNRAGAVLQRKTQTSQVYTSQRLNKTFTIFAVKPGVVRIQILAGCACDT